MAQAGIEAGIGVSGAGAASAAKTASKRDYRLDFFRGLALVFIFIDHIPDNGISYFTLRSFAFCDAAEVFIFISGYTAALAYAPLFAREGVAMGFARIWRRVWQLYVAHLCLFMIFNAEVAYTLKFHNNPLFADELRVGDFLDNPSESFIRVLTLQFQPSLLNILPLYIVLLLGLPFVILCFRRHVLLALIPSAALYGAASLFDWNLAAFPEGRLWYFNPLAWQFLFVLSAALGYLRATGRSVHTIPYLTAPHLTAIALCFAAVSAVIQFSWTLHELNHGFPLFLSMPNIWFDKTMLPPARLAGILALAILVASFVPRDARFLTSPAGWVVILCGQNSLEVFCLGILLSVMANFALNLVGYAMIAQVLVNLGGLLIMVGVGLQLAWFRGGGRVPAAPRARGAS